MELDYYTFTAKKDGSIFGVLKSNTDNIEAGEGEVIRKTFYKEDTNVEKAYEAYWNFKLVEEDSAYKIIAKEPNAG